MKKQYHFDQSERRPWSLAASRVASNAIDQAKWEQRIRAARIVHKSLAAAFSIGLLGLVLLGQLGQSTVARAWASEPTKMAAVSEWGGAGRAPLTLFSSDTITAFLPLVGKSFGGERPLWRFGAAQLLHPIADYDSTEIKRLRLGWYVDWQVTSDAPQPYGIEYVPVIRVKQLKWQPPDPTPKTFCIGCPYMDPPQYTVEPDPSVIASTASAHPGMMWVIGNEIDRIDFKGGRQDEIVPELYAQAYGELYSLLKSADPSARVAIGGMVEATPLRLQYLDRVWSAYLAKYSTTMPVDVWNIHSFVLREKSCAAYPTDCWGADIPAGITSATMGMNYTISDNKNFSLAWGQIRDLRSWMKAHGQQDKPLIITEYGVNIPDYLDPGQFTPEQVRDSFMYPSFTTFLNTTDAGLGYPADGYRLVQRWNWYSLDDDSGYYEEGVHYQFYNGNLFHSGSGSLPQGLAPLGTYWQQYVQNLPEGSSPPYASSKSVGEGGAPRAVPGRLPNCSMTVKVLFYEPAHSPTPLMGAAVKSAPSSSLREIPVCR